MVLRCSFAACKFHNTIFNASKHVLSTQPWCTSTIRLSQATVFHRTKTTTIVKANALPQGGLPAIIREDPPPSKDRIPKMIQQHINNVNNFRECVVLTEVGDFFELYHDQVDQYAHLVNLKKAKKGDIAMAGFQKAQLPRYLKMFVQDLGKSVALSEQFRLPDDDASLKSGKPRWDRKVTRVITAGTLIDESFLDPFENNYLLAIHVDDWPTTTTIASQLSGSVRPLKRSTKVGLSWVDLSSGDFFTQQSDLTSTAALVARIGPREIVLDSRLATSGQAELQRILGDGSFSISYHTPTDSEATISAWAPILSTPIPDAEMDSFTAVEIEAGSLVLEYVRDRMRDSDITLQCPIKRTDDECMIIDRQSLRNLEIRSILHNGNSKGSLLHTFRATVTKSGARLLSQRITSPSMSLPVINARLDLAQEMLKYDILHEDVVGLLKLTSDTCRLLQKFSVGRGDADDLLGLAGTIQLTNQLSSVLREHVSARQIARMEHSGFPAEGHNLSFVVDILDRLDLESPTKVAKAISAAIDEEGLKEQHFREHAVEVEAEGMVEEAELADEAGEQIPKFSRRGTRSSTPAKATAIKVDDIWIMKRQASDAMEKAHRVLDEMLADREQLALRLRAHLKSQSMTLRWSSTLGHHCHVKSTDARGLISTLKGARNIASTKSSRSFYYESWTDLGRDIDEAKLRIRAEEERVFKKLRGLVLENLMRLRRNAAVLDELDVACSTATVAKQRKLVRPILNDGTSHNIIGGRHPTVDVGLIEQGRTFTSNDCAVGDGDGRSEKIYLITGPNMAGKSTYLRQNALITVLAQTGCFVPADYAELGLVDRLFSRVGSADNIYQDQSTFMVEMLETADILKQATLRSFVVMDEVGRGTTPEDGVAVAFACLHHLQHVNGCRALFATHFHALADMTKEFENLACYCTDVAEGGDGSWSYMHRLRKGVNRESHALKVARLAGLPESAIAVAADVLARYQKE